jgi:hypothetical protein
MSPERKRIYSQSNKGTLEYFPFEILLEGGSELQCGCRVRRKVDRIWCKLPPHKKFGSDCLGGSDKVFTLFNFAFRVPRVNGRVKKVGNLGVCKQDSSLIKGRALTPKTPSLPVIAFLRDSTSQRSACTTSAPRAFSFSAFSDDVLRVTARGTNVPSASIASSTAEPMKKI